jgi:hypothetical protein
MRHPELKNCKEGNKRKKRKEIKATMTGPKTSKRMGSFFSSP